MVDYFTGEILGKIDEFMSADLSDATEEEINRIMAAAEALQKSFHIVGAAALPTDGASVKSYNNS